MKKRSLIILVAVALLVLAGLAAYAYSNQTAANKHCVANCPKFTDANHDGVCDAAAQCHKDGKCTRDCSKSRNCDPAQCSPGKCDPSKCPGHQH